MEIATEEYKGYTIAVTPIKDHSGLWDFEYRLNRSGQEGIGQADVAVARSKTAGGAGEAAWWFWHGVRN